MDPKWYRAQVIANVVVAIFAAVTSWVGYQQYYILRGTNRPAVYLGLSDGTIADFVVEKGREKVVLHFRNYGQRTARNVQVETWPTVLAPSSSVTAKIPPPEGSRNGPDVPPGFSVIHYQTYPGATRRELQSGTKMLLIAGRVRYDDTSRVYCETFSLGYTLRVNPRFTLVTSAGSDLCDGSVDLITASWDDQEK